MKEIRMEKVRVELGERSYDICIGKNILRNIGGSLKSFGLSPRIAIVTNPTVYPLYGAVVAKLFEKGWL